MSVPSRQASSDSALPPTFGATVGVVGAEDEEFAAGLVVGVAVDDAAADLSPLPEPQAAIDRQLAAASAAGSARRRFITDLPE